MTHVLGNTTQYPESYSPEILEGIPRQKPRNGVDIWTCYEVSWCTPDGKPQVGIAQMRVPASSPKIVESKSLKLYLNSMNNERLTRESFIDRWRNDVGSCIEATLDIAVLGPEEWHAVSCKKLEGTLIDSVLPNADCPWHTEKNSVSESLHTHLFRSLCPVTSQPDWATIDITYSGKQIASSKLLYELTHQRNKQGFHESCVDDIFDMVLENADCSALTVSGYFTRRGGIDITPIRSTETTFPDWKRQFRQ